ncbi:MAG: hypothetical protein NUV63_13580 [Gallionella sp.]|nr:hypothetical protein [Gallionella sp.]
MRKVILMVLLAVVSNSALAEWDKVGSNEIVTIYTDSTTISRTGNMATMWHLTDFKRVKKDMGATYMSTKDQYEYDCKEEKSRRRAFSEHSKSMGGGEVVYSDSFTTKWKAVPPDSGIEILWKIACEKK